MSNVKKATRAELEALRNFTDVFKRMSCFKDFDVSDEAVDAYLDAITADPNTIVFTNGVGALGASVEKAEMNMGFILRERFFMSKPGEGRELLDAFHVYAKTKGVDLTALSLICKDGKIPSKLHDYYIDMGYEMTEAVYVRKVD